VAWLCAGRRRRRYRRRRRRQSTQPPPPRCGASAPATPPAPALGTYKYTRGGAVSHAELVRIYISHGCITYYNIMCVCVCVEGREAGGRGVRYSCKLGSGGEARSLCGSTAPSSEARSAQPRCGEPHSRCAEVDAEPKKVNGGSHGAHSRRPSTQDQRGRRSWLLLIARRGGGVSSLAAASQPAHSWAASPSHASSWNGKRTGSRRVCNCSWRPAAQLRRWASKSASTSGSACPTPQLLLAEPRCAHGRPAHADDSQQQHTTPSLSSPHRLIGCRRNRR
jgi:hypothetical protein